MWKNKFDVEPDYMDPNAILKPEAYGRIGNAGRWILRRIPWIALFAACVGAFLLLNGWFGQFRRGSSPGGEVFVLAVPLVVLLVSWIDGRGSGDGK